MKEDGQIGAAAAGATVARSPAGTAAGATSTLAPSIAILLSTFFWGTLWIPLRRSSEAGLGGPWATLAGFVLPLLLLLPAGVLRRRAIVAGGWPLLQAGLLTAVCFALYAEALLRGTVARVILLFYLTPVWSTLMARAFLAVPITASRMVTIALGLTGMFVVFGVEGGVPLPHDSGEWMGLLSGLLWAAAMVMLRRLPEAVSEFDRVFVQLWFLGAAFVLLTLVPGGRAWTPLGVEPLLASARWLLLLGLVWMPAVLGLTMYGASRLDPGRVAVLLTLEIVIGLVSAAVLTDEPFGGRDMIGAVLVTAACGSEFFSVRAST